MYTMFLPMNFIDCKKKYGNQKSIFKNVYIIMELDGIHNSFSLLYF